MDSSEKERADIWFREKWRYGTCPVCGVDDWELLPNLGQIENLDTDVVFGPEGGGWPIHRGRVPVLLVGCTNCGHMVTVNALVAGVRQLPTEPSSAEGE